MTKGYNEYKSADPLFSTGKQNVLDHIGLVQRIALHLKARLPNFVELEELVQIGMVGLMEAYHNFDEAEGSDLAAFASKRIKGAIIDEVRRRSPLSRNDNNHIRDEETITSRFFAEHSRQPTSSEIATIMDLSVEEYHIARTKSHTFLMSSFEEISEAGHEFENEQASPEESLSHLEHIEILGHRINALPERSQLILSLYYEQELNLKEIGVILDVSESRVSQLLKKIVSQVRNDI